MKDEWVTDGGYIFEVPDLKNEPDVSISLSFGDAYDILPDGLESEASLEPLNDSTFKHNALVLLGLLMDASEELAEEDLAEETYQEYCERMRVAFTPEMLEEAALRQARIEAGAEVLSRFFDAGWDELSPAERRVFKGYAKAVLDAADEVTDNDKKGGTK